jgi:hypothetical protein
VLLLVVLLGLKDADTPRGSPDAVKLTAPVKAFCDVMVIVEATLPLRARLNAFGEAEIAKFGGATTVNETVVVCDSGPDFPVMVIEKVPRAAALLTVSVSVLELVVLVGLNEAVTPLGKPDAERATLLVKPFIGLTVIVLVPFAP